MLPRKTRALAFAFFISPVTTTMALNLDTLWDFQNPALSEQRFNAALSGASPDEQLILRTQIARSWGLRREFDKAREVLAALEPRQAGASAEARVRYHLELGRTHASATHGPAARTPANQDAARQHYLQAADIAKRAGLDGLAVDALHMMCFVDTAPEQQLTWNAQALALATASSQDAARRWEGPLRNNIGLVHQQRGEHAQALQEFRLSRAAYERAGRTRQVRIADWMIARTLRAQQKLDEALALQLGLESAWDADGQPDPYVYEELAHLYRELGDEARAVHYAAKRAK
jgi:hypothetical protein